MSFATGSGDYVAFMNAILSFAVADGWVEDGGVGTGWPISSPGGRVRGVDWTTTTQNENDVTVGGAGGVIQSRYIRLAIGSSPADATANAVANLGSHFLNAHYTFSSWWLFSDPASGADYVHAVVKFSNGANPDVYSHMSFGEIQRFGMTHGGIAYAMCHNARGWARNANSGNLSEAHNSYNRGHKLFSGQYGETDDSFSDLTHMCQAPLAANPAAGYSAADADRHNGEGVLDTTGLGTDSDNILGYDGQLGGGYKFTTGVHNSIMPPFSGAISLMNCPFILINSTATGARGTYCGDFPNVRMCGLGNTFLGEEEITYAGETWQIFPWLRNTANGILNDSAVVTSGRLGVAYKKVV
jgi:hypothetical protein